MKIGFLAKFYADFIYFQKKRTTDFLEIMIFEKKFPLKLIICSVLIGILSPGSIKIERGMKKYSQGFILRCFGLMGSSLVPGEGPTERENTAPSGTHQGYYMNNSDLKCATVTITTGATKDIM